MKAVAVTPGKPNSVHLTDVKKPSLDEVKDGHGVLVKVLKVGVDATDREINDALYGNAPPGDSHLVIGHESFGVVEAVGPNVRNIKPGDYVTATVRRPGGSIYDAIGRNDITSEETYYEGRDSPPAMLQLPRRAWFAPARSGTPGTPPTGR